jgi:hypothetical protein
LKRKCVIGKPSSKQTKPPYNNLLKPLFGLKREQNRIEFMVVRPCNTYNA